ncbi:MAG: sensor histidine kinase, partial [Chloroflexus sp.]
MSFASIRHFWRTNEPIASAIRLAGWYLLIAGSWVLFSDRLLAAIIVNIDIKGWLFVLLMAGWLGIER